MPTITRYPTLYHDHANVWNNEDHAFAAGDSLYADTYWSSAQTDARDLYLAGFDCGIPAGATLVSVTVVANLRRSSGTGTLIVRTGHGDRNENWTWETDQNYISGWSATSFGDVSVALTQIPTIDELNEAASSSTVFSVFVSVSKSGTGTGTVYLDYVKVVVVYAVYADLTTAAASSVTQVAAASGGNVTDANGTTITEKGVCWNTTGTPTIADPHTSDGSGTGAFTSALTGLYPSFRYYVRAYATNSDGDTSYGPQEQFDTLPSANRSLVVRPFSTRAAGAEFVARQSDAIVDWWIEDGVARAELRPSDVAAIPRARWYVVSRDTPGASVSLVMDSEDTPDIVCVVYKAYGVTGVRDGTIRRVYCQAAPTSLIERVALVDLTGQFMGDGEATSYAENTMRRAAADVMSAKITVPGGLYTVDGHWRPAPLILAGDWIDVVDHPDHAPTYITGTTFERASDVVTITTGGREQSDLVLPGISALPQALTVYGADTAYETYTQPGITKPDPGMTDPGGVPWPGVDPGKPFSIGTEPEVGGLRDLDNIVIPSGMDF